MFRFGVFSKPRMSTDLQMRRLIDDLTDDKILFCQSIKLKG